MANVLLRPILWVTHYFIFLRSLIWSFFPYACRQLALILPPKTQGKIATDAKQLEKLPIHIGLVIVEDNVSFTDVANVILWCMAMGISHVSVYDRNGIVKCQKATLESEVQQKKSSIESAESSLKYSSINIQAGFPKGQEQGREDELKVVLLERRDGLPSLVSTARRLAVAVKHKQTLLKDITPSHVDTLMQEERDHYFPDPDMILRFGETQCMMGYLPWQMRLSEILSLPTHHNLDYESFHKAVISYGSLEQRFGK